MSSDHQYWSARAEAELARAAQSDNTAARKAHYELAGLYLDRVHGGGAERPAGPAPALRLVR